MGRPPAGHEDGGGRFSVRQGTVMQVTTAATEAPRAQYEQGQGATSQLQASIAALQAEFAALDEEANLQSFGFYRPRYSFAEAAHYQARLEDIRASQKRMLADGTAVDGQREPRRSFKPFTQCTARSRSPSSPRRRGTGSHTLSGKSPPLLHRRGLRPLQPRARQAAVHT